ncbi:MAG: hypothetical protein ACO1OO_07340 [Flavisolibacter sp.]
MKTTLTFLAALLLFTSAHSQVHMEPSQVKQTFSAPGQTLIGAVAFGHDVLARLAFSVQGADTTYHFYYLDQNYKQIGQYYNISIQGQKNLRQFYAAMKAAFLPENMPRNQQATFVEQMTVGNVDVMLTNLKRFRDMQVIFTTADGHVLGLTESQVDVLFGKRS